MSKLEKTDGEKITFLVPGSVFFFPNWFRASSLAVSPALQKSISYPSEFRDVCPIPLSVSAARHMTRKGTKEVESLLYTPHEFAISMVENPIWQSTFEATTFSCCVASPTVLTSDINCSIDTVSTDFRYKLRDAGPSRKEAKVRHFSSFSPVLASETASLTALSQLPVK